MKRYTFWKSCPELTREEVELQRVMLDRAVDVTYRTFRRAVGAAELDAWASAHGYDVGTQRGGLRLSNDWHVRYCHSWWGDEPCWFLQWSAMEMIWRRDSNNPDSGEKQWKQ